MNEDYLAEEKKIEKQAASNFFPSSSEYVSEIRVFHLGLMQKKGFWNLLELTKIVFSKSRLKQEAENGLSISSFKYGHFE